MNDFRRTKEKVPQNFQFLHDPSDEKEEGEDDSNRAFYDKLFKEYGLVNLEKYKEGKLGIRWRTREEVLNHKGDKICGNLNCKKDGSRTIETNFKYQEKGETKNALVKVFLCGKCSKKMKKVKKYKKRKKRKRKEKKRRKLSGNGMEIKKERIEKRGFSVSMEEKEEEEERVRKKRKIEK